MNKKNPVLERIWKIYIGIGSFPAVISTFSCLIYYGFGPGAVWNIGFTASAFGLFFSLLYSMLRVVTWPFGVFVLIVNPGLFFPWLFYLWY